MSLRILFVTHAPANSLTAVYRTVCDQADYLRCQGHHVDVITRDDLASSRWSRLDPIVLPVLLLTRRLSAYDVLIFHSYFGWGFHLLKRLVDPHGRVTTITWFHGLEPLYHRAVSDEYRRVGRQLSRRFRWLHQVVLPRLLRRTSQASHAVFCLNSLEADYLAAHGWAEPTRIHRVANGVEPDAFVSRIHRRVARRLLFVGQWLPAKGVRYLADAFNELAAVSDVELACVGTGAPASEVLEAFDPSVRSRVTVMPRVGRPDLYEQLKLADVFLFPSLSEGFSCALLEALAAELPTVATNVGAAVDLLESGRNGILVPQADAAALAAAVATLIEDVHTRSRLGEAAGRSSRRFTAENVRAEFAGSVSEVVRRHKRGDVQQVLRRGDALSLGEKRR